MTKTKFSLCSHTFSILSKVPLYCVHNTKKLSEFKSSKGYADEWHWVFLPRVFFDPILITHWPHCQFSQLVCNFTCLTIYSEFLSLQPVHFSFIKPSSGETQWECLVGKQYIHRHRYCCLSLTESETFDYLLLSQMFLS